jgi:hypothetical protein
MCPMPEQLARLLSLNTVRVRFGRTTLGGMGMSIKWRNDLPPEDARRCYVALENGKWVQRDGHGNIYGTGL